MRYLSFGLDPSLIDPSSAGFARQLAYAAGAEATIITFHPGKQETIQRETLTVIQTGGSSKIAALWRGFCFALQQPIPDVVTAQDAGPLGLLAWMMARHFQAELFLQDHSGVFARPAFGWKEVLFRPISAALFRSADQVRVVSERAKKGLMRIGVDSQKISVQPIRTDVRVFADIQHSPQKEPLIVCVARLEKEKGIDILLKAFSLLHVSAHLRLIGDGSERTHLEQLVKQLKLDDRVTFVGKQSREEIRQAFATAGVYVQPSHFEGWGMAVVEAAAAGLPIVMTDVGCAGELLKQEESVLIVRPGDAVGLARAIERLIKDRGLAERMGKRAKKAAMNLPGPEEGVKEMREWLLALSSLRRRGPISSE